MPIYEYRCDDCGKNFLIKLSMPEHEKGGITCPACSGGRVVQQHSGFFAKTSKKS